MAICNCAFDEHFLLAFFFFLLVFLNEVNFQETSEYYFVFAFMGVHIW